MKQNDDLIVNYRARIENIKTKEEIHNTQLPLYYY